MCVCACVGRERACVYAWGGGVRVACACVFVCLLSVCVSVCLSISLFVCLYLNA